MNHRQKLLGHVFSGRYKALIGEGSGNGYLKAACDYVHLNPARAHLLGKEDLGVWNDPPPRPPPRGDPGPYTNEPCGDVDPTPDYENVLTELKTAAASDRLGVGCSRAPRFRGPRDGARLAVRDGTRAGPPTTC
jgi:hypothetical protein